MEDFSIDQTKLPGVKMVCRDFAVLEDHSLAHSLQEQEIESHLASNIHKSRLVQQDLQVAKRLQEEEDLRARAGVRKRQKDIERNDSEIAQEIQEQLVRQAERQREQEEKDAAIARKLQEREQLKEERRRKKYQDAAYEESCYEEKGASRPRHGDSRPASRSMVSWAEPLREPPGPERVARSKERPPRPPPPCHTRQVEDWNSESDEERRRHRRKDRVPSASHQEWDGVEEADRERGHTRREHHNRDLEACDSNGQSHHRRDGREDFRRSPCPMTHPKEDREERGRECAENVGDKGRSHDKRETPRRPPRPDLGSGRNGRLQSELQDTTQGLSELDLREQEVRDMEVARRLQEQELKARNLDKRAAQVAQDEEIARLMMEEEEMMYKKSRDRERKRQEEDWRPGTDDAVKPRSGQEEYEQHRSRHQKPARPPAPLHEYENVRPTYPEPSCSPQFSARPNATNRGYYRQ